MWGDTRSFSSSSPVPRPWANGWEASVVASAKLAAVKKLVSQSDRATLDKDIAAWVPKKPDSTGNLVAITDPTWKVAKQPATSAPAAATSAPEQVGDGELIVKAQQLLSDMGYDVGPMDGVMGSRTGNAVRLFQLQTGQPVNGTVSPELIQLLESRRS